MAAINGIGVIGKTNALPLPSENENDWSKKNIAEKLLSLFTNPKSNPKVKEMSAVSLGYICVGEQFPYTKLIIQKFIDTANEVQFYISRIKFLLLM